jgi:hypothetical protein
MFQVVAASGLIDPFLFRSIHLGYVQPDESSTILPKLFTGFSKLSRNNVTHYLDDFLIVLPANTDITSYSQQFDILDMFGLSKAAEKDS